MNKIQIGTPVFSKDAHEAGEVDRLILDPATGQLTYVALKANGMLTRDIVVPVAAILLSDERGLWLDLTVVGLENMPDYVEDDFVSPAEGELPLGAYGHGEVLVPVAHVGRATAFKNDLRAGKHVECQDGVCGTVKEVMVDPVTRRAVSFLVKRGGKLSRDVVVPVEWVLEARGDRVVLDCNVRQLEESLPPAKSLERALG